MNDAGVPSGRVAPAADSTTADSTDATSPAADALRRQPGGDDGLDCAA